MTGETTTEETTMTLRRRISRVVMATGAALLAAAAAAPAAGAADFDVAAFSGALVASDGTRLSQAGAHPDVTTTFRLTTTHDAWGNTVPAENLRNVDVDLPPGIVGNPTVVPACPAAKLAAQSLAQCSDDSQVGVATVDLSLGLPDPVPVPFQLYNVVPPRGVAARFGFNAFGVVTVLDAVVDPEGGYHIRVRSKDTSQGLAISAVGVTFWGVPADPVNDDQRGACIFGGGSCPSSLELRPMMSNATACATSPQRTSLRLNTWQDPQIIGSAFDHDTFGEPWAATGCDAVPFEPAMQAQLGTTKTDAPTGLIVDLAFPQTGMEDPDVLATSHLRKAKVTLPEGMTINPASADGLTACTDAQMGFGDGRPVRCPDASRIGNVWATTPLLAERLGGGVYVGSQLSDDPESGQMFRIFLLLENEDRGVRIKLPGAIRVDRGTGRLEATFDGTPQLPVSTLRVQFKGGERAPLATPTACGSGDVVGQFESWSGQTRYASAPVTFACPGADTFAPSFTAGSLDATAGAFAPFTVRIARPQGQQALGGLSMRMPPGVLAKLDGIPLCSDADANAGTCDQASRVGDATVGAGAGNPYHLKGGVYLTGPYRGAPFGLAVMVPAVAGPYDLGKVVVRQALHIDPADAHVTIVSDPLPTVVKGVPIRLQSLVVDMNRPGFMVNPTSCADQRITATLTSDRGASVEASERFAVAGCDRLALEPKLELALPDPAQAAEGDHPALDAVLTQGAGQSNLRSARIVLPLSMALDVNNAQALCTPEQAAAKACPPGSVVGHAKAVTPLLHEPLEGDVYFVEGRRTTASGQVRRTFPKLWVALRGAVALDVWADTDVDERQRLVTTFASIPDAPLWRFELRLAGGEHGILVLNEDVCRRAQRADATFDGHSGRQASERVTITSSCPAARIQKQRSV